MPPPNYPALPFFHSLHTLTFSISCSRLTISADFNCNKWGGEAFSHTLSNIPAYTSNTVGYTNISSSDNKVHGQVKSAGHFSFVRIYESGHEVPFYQPLVSLEMLNRTIMGYDIATGTTKVTASYGTKGSVNSTFVNGNGTVLYSIVPENATYNYTTDMPNPPYDLGGQRAEMVKRDAERVERDGLPAWMSRRVRTKKGRAVLFEGSSQKKSHGGRRQEL